MDDSDKSIQNLYHDKLEFLNKELNDIKELVKTFTNDQELGEKIRKLINNKK